MGIRTCEKHTRFVAEYAFDLPELFDEGGGTTEGGVSVCARSTCRHRNLLVALVGISRLMIRNIGMRLWCKDDEHEYI